MEDAFDADLSAVRVHAGPRAEAASRSLGARAYAAGQDIVLGQAPSKELVAHEVAHTVQQRRGGAAGRPGAVSRKASGKASGDAIEAAADSAARDVAAGRPAGPVGTDTPGRVRGWWDDDEGGGGDDGGGGSWLDDAVDTVTGAVETVAGAVDQGVGAASDTARDWVDQGTETVEGVADTVESVVDEGVKTVQGWASDFGALGIADLTGAGGAGSDGNGGAEGTTGDVPNPLDSLTPEERFDYHICAGDPGMAVADLASAVAVDRRAVRSIEYDASLGVPATTDGEMETPQRIRIGPLALDVGYNYALSTLGHEIQHARQKSGADPIVKIASEREYLAYTWEALNESNPDRWTRYDAAVRSQAFWRMWEEGRVGRDDNASPVKDETYWARKFLERYAGRQAQVRAILNDPKFRNAQPTTTVCEATSAQIDGDTGSRTFG
jgi:hypothetical protein